VNSSIPARHRSAARPGIEGRREERGKGGVLDAGRLNSLNPLNPLNAESPEAAELSPNLC
jgi:hypothetical protein